jgi:uncharacterized protein YqjF (DUF2071 family)
MPQTFLTAEWRKLIMANYVIDPALLKPYLPAQTELDLFDGKCYVSLVGFMFQNTRLKGIRVPLHIQFEEVNLRFYVHHTGKDSLRKRGVVFIKEIVPRAALSFVANTFYGEKYETLPMHHKWHSATDSLIVAYRWKKAGIWQKLQVTADPIAIAIAEGSAEEFITEHYWGYTKLRNGRTSEYEVVHPRWDIFPVKRHVIDVDFGQLYGPRWAALRGAEPESVLLAEGSEVTVRSGSAIHLIQG